MQVTITQSPALNLVGLKADVALDPNQTRALRQKFGPWRAKIENRADDNTYAVDIYPGNYLKDFKPQTVFEKWAAVAVKEKPKILPVPLEVLEVEPALYAEFQHKGPASAVGKTYNHILSQWLPQSKYQLRALPHIAVMPANYQPADVNAQEKIWIPLKETSV
jgi:AraC family transcriptional regulator